jgi:hypothetical protein
MVNNDSFRISDLVEIAELDHFRSDLEFLQDFVMQR